MTDHTAMPASYAIVSQADGTFGVRVTIEDTFPTLVTSFATEGDAEIWIARHKERVREDPKKKRGFAQRRA